MTKFGPRGIFNYGGTEIKGSKRARQLTKLFCQLLANNRLDQARSDLPSGESPQAQKKRKATIQKWIRVCDDLIEQEQGHRTIKKVMKWYFNHHRETRMGSYYAMTTFAENYPKIEKMMRRSANGNLDRADAEEEYNPIITAVYEI